ncbi:hypothetical protein SAMN06295885_3547 [Rathayibacter oskolensis]|uniref:Uncharacterized protein n=1 Tax=Rathayibacter oskolensis TaxID=1891671 RepID=A0A1X7PHV3_9MICO|nr:hypothetical protein [Rathayibacter oskolensis]SMH50442.1 hypothetical protein SAMN06295885_3547 [Rathayibacter oskolensis]
MARIRSTLTLEALVSALAVPEGIHPALARRVSEDASRSLRPTAHRRVPAGGSPLAAFSDIDAAPDASPFAHL